jgi:hypothetical protein
MNSKQREAAYRLLVAVESDAELKEEAADYGNWHAYLMQHVQDQDNDD